MQLLLAGKDIFKRVFVEIVKAMKFSQSSVLFWHNIVSHVSWKALHLPTRAWSWFLIRYVPIWKSFPFRNDCCPGFAHIPSSFKKSLSRCNCELWIGGLHHPIGKAGTATGNTGFILLPSHRFSLGFVAHLRFRGTVYQLLGYPTGWRRNALRQLFHV